MSDEGACPTCGKAPVVRDDCASCGTELRDVFNDPTCRQYEDALEIGLGGGYGMFFDNIDGDHHVFLCGDCARSACNALPWLGKLFPADVTNTEGQQ